MTRPLHYMSIADVAALIRSRELSPVELAQAQLDRISELDPRLRTYATVIADRALDQAKQAEADIARGNYRGALHGVPVAVKDLCATEGVRTMGGCAALADNIPAEDSTVVARLKQAGAVMLGKLNMTEGAMGGYNPELQYPENPWKEGHWSGASSSGSGAATAAGLAFGTLGSDTGGSIRHPAAVCGVVGLKPTWGRVSRHGVVPLAESLDHVGPLVRRSVDAGIMLQAIAGRDPADATSLPDPVPDMLEGIGKGMEGIRIGWDQDYASTDVATDFADAVEKGVEVMESLGARIVPVRMPERLREYLEAWPVLCSSEAVAAHAATYPARAGEYGPWFREWLDQGAAHGASDYARAHSLRLRCVGELRLTMLGIDVLACPSTARAAYPVTPEQMYGPIPADRTPWDSRFTAPYNFSGLPSIAVPCGLSGDGLPLSLQFVGHALSEPLLVQVGDAYERGTRWHELHPPL